MLNYAGQIAVSSVYKTWRLNGQAYFQANDNACTSFWPNDALWRRRSGSTLAQVMACCLTATSHYMNQCWFITSRVPRNYSEGNIVIRSENTKQCNNIMITSWWTRLRLKSQASRLFTQAFIQEQVKENIKAPCHWPLRGEFNGDQRIPRTNCQ